MTVFHKRLQQRLDEKKMKAKSRFQIRNSYLLLVDIFLTIVSVVGAFALRLDIDYYRYLPERARCRLYASCEKR